MKIAVLGSTGKAGSEIVKELAARGHDVTGIARSVPDVPVQGVTYARGDVTDTKAIGALVAGHDAVVSATVFATVDTPAVIEAIKAAGVPRILVVGGAGSLHLPDGTRLFDAPGFPEAYKAEAQGGIDTLAALKAGEGIEWTFLSPSMNFEVGPRTGIFRLGDDDLLTAEDGRSHISYADFAIAIADEAESRAHSGRRFTIGY